MNGRVYDPELGVFLSADPLVQFPHSTQGLNRYAYVGNNPLSYTDPSGHLIFGLIAAAIMVKVESWVVATVIAAVAGYLDTGSLKSAFFSGLSAGLGFGVGDFVKTMGFESAFAVGFATATTHGLIQGSISAAQGGRFGSGAMAGFAGSVLGQKGGRPPSLAGAIRAAVVGGTVSRIGGGKFANGAAMASFRKLPRQAHSLNLDSWPVVDLGKNWVHRTRRLTTKQSIGRIDRMAAKADNVKAKARELIEQLPDNATWDDVAYEIAVRRSIERGLADLDAGRTYTSEALLASLGLNE